MHGFVAVEAYTELDTYRTELLGNLCATLTTKSNKTSHLQDLQEAVIRYGDILQLAGINDGEEARQLLDFSHDIFQQFEKSGQITDLQTAISLRREGRALLPVHYPIGCKHPTTSQ